MSRVETPKRQRVFFDGIDGIRYSCVSCWSDRRNGVKGIFADSVSAWMRPDAIRHWRL
jgi:hypothetical protein